jgi:hypothetical protein
MTQTGRLEGVDDDPSRIISSSDALRCCGWDPSRREFALADKVQLKKNWFRIVVNDQDERLPGL